MDPALSSQAPTMADEFGYYPRTPNKISFGNDEVSPRGASDRKISSSDCHSHNKKSRFFFSSLKRKSPRHTVADENGSPKSLQKKRSFAEIPFKLKSSPHSNVIDENGIPRRVSKRRSIADILPSLTPTRSRKLLDVVDIDDNVQSRREKTASPPRKKPVLPASPSRSSRRKSISDLWGSISSRVSPRRDSAIFFDGRFECDPDAQELQLDLTDVPSPNDVPGTSRSFVIKETESDQTRPVGSSPDTSANLESQESQISRKPSISSSLIGLKGTPRRSTPIQRGESNAPQSDFNSPIATRDEADEAPAPSTPGSTLSRAITAHDALDVSSPRPRTPESYINGLIEAYDALSNAAESSHVDFQDITQIRNGGPKTPDSFYRRFLESAMPQDEWAFWNQISDLECRDIISLPPSYFDKNIADIDFGVVEYLEDGRFQNSPALFAQPSVTVRELADSNEDSLDIDPKFHSTRGERKDRYRDLMKEPRTPLQSSSEMLQSNIESVVANMTKSYHMVKAEDHSSQAERKIQDSLCLCPFGFERDQMEVWDSIITGSRTLQQVPPSQALKSIPSLETLRRRHPPVEKILEESLDMRKLHGQASSDSRLDPAAEALASWDSAVPDRRNSRRRATTSTKIRVEFPKTVNLEAHAEIYENKTKAITALYEYKLGELSNFCTWDPSTHTIFAHALESSVPNPAVLRQAGLEVMWLPMQKGNLTSMQAKANAPQERAWATPPASDLDSADTDDLLAAKSCTLERLGMQVDSEAEGVNSGPSSPQASAGSPEHDVEGSIFQDDFFLEVDSDTARRHLGSQYWENSRTSSATGIRHTPRFPSDLESDVLWTLDEDEVVAPIKTWPQLAREFLAVHPTPSFRDSEEEQETDGSSLYPASETGRLSSRKCSPLLELLTQASDEIAPGPSREGDEEVKDSDRLKALHEHFPPTFHVRRKPVPQYDPSVVDARLKPAGRATDEFFQHPVSEKVSTLLDRYAEYIQNAKMLASNFESPTSGSALSPPPTFPQVEYNEHRETPNKTERLHPDYDLLASLARIRKATAGGSEQFASEEELTPRTRSDSLHDRLAELLQEMKLNDPDFESTITKHDSRQPENSAEIDCNDAFEIMEQFQALKDHPTQQLLKSLKHIRQNLGDEMTPSSGSSCPMPSFAEDIEELNYVQEEDSVAEEDHIKQGDSTDENYDLYDDEQLPRSDKKMRRPNKYQMSIESPTSNHRGKQRSKPRPNYAGELPTPSRQLMNSGAKDGSDLDGLAQAVDSHETSGRDEVDGLSWFYEDRELCGTDEADDKGILGGLSIPKNGLRNETSKIPFPSQEYLATCSRLSSVSYTSYIEAEWARQGLYQEYFAAPVQFETKSETDDRQSVTPCLAEGERLTDSETKSQPIWFPWFANNEERKHDNRESRRLGSQQQNEPEGPAERKASRQTSGISTASGFKFSQFREELIGRRVSEDAEIDIRSSSGRTTRQSSGNSLISLIDPFLENSEYRKETAVESSTAEILVEDERSSHPTGPRQSFLASDFRFTNQATSQPIETRKGLLPTDFRLTDYGIFGQRLSYADVAKYTKDANESPLWERQAGRGYLHYIPTRADAKVNTGMHKGNYLSPPTKLQELRLPRRPGVLRNPRGRVRDSFGLTVQKGPENSASWKRTMKDLNIRAVGKVARQTAPSETQSGRVGALVDVFQAQGLMQPMRPSLRGKQTPSPSQKQSRGRSPTPHIVTPSPHKCDPEITVIGDPLLSLRRPRVRKTSSNSGNFRPCSRLSDVDTDVSSIFGEQLERVEKHSDDSEGRESNHAIRL